MAGREEIAICDVLGDAELRTVSLIVERPLSPRDMVRAMRTLSHVVDARERICRG